MARCRPRQASALVTRSAGPCRGDLKALAVLEEQATGVPLIAGNKVTLLFDGPATMREMMAAARAATTSINLETYIFDQDEIGSEFADLLMEKQRQGVQVNIMVDAVGQSRHAIGLLRAHARGRHPRGDLQPGQPGQGQGQLGSEQPRPPQADGGRRPVAFTGGINISSTYANSSLFRSKNKARKIDGDKVGWRDTHIKIEGPAVARAAVVLRQPVGAAGRRRPADAEYFPRLAPAGDKFLRVLADHAGARFRDLQIAGGGDQRSEDLDPHHLRLFRARPADRRCPGRRRQARRGREAGAAGRVRPQPDPLRRPGLLRPLLAGGVRIFELQVAVLHAKTAVIDGAWSTIGSANIDRRSFIHNYELNVVVIDPAFGRDMESAFNEDMRDSKEVTLESGGTGPGRIGSRRRVARLGEYWI
jgi:cardiolipin synthase